MVVPRYQRRMPEVNEAVIATYLAGGNTRRIRGALQPLLKAAPLSKSAVSRVMATLKDGLEAWRTRSLTDLDVIYFTSMAVDRAGHNAVVLCVEALAGGVPRRQRHHRLQAGSGRVSASRFSEAPDRVDGETRAARISDLVPEPAVPVLAHPASAARQERMDVHADLGARRSPEPGGTALQTSTSDKSPCLGPKPFAVPPTRRGV